MMSKRTVVWLAFGAALTAAMGATAAPTTMLTSSRVNNLTFSHAVALPGVTLAPGTYSFESWPQSLDPNLIRVTTVNHQKVLDAGFTIPIVRPKGNNNPVSFGEAAAGAPAPIVAWYPIGSNRGHGFRYR